MICNDITKVAAEYHCESVAFPLLSSGNYCYPKERP